MVLSIVTCLEYQKTLPGRYAGGSGVEENYISSWGLRPT